MNRRDHTALVAAVVAGAISLLAGCTYQQGIGLSCDDEGSVDGDRVCRDGAWVPSNGIDTDGGDGPADGGGGTEDTSVPGDDAGTPPDMGSPDDLGSPTDMGMSGDAGTDAGEDMQMCVPETNLEFCGRLELNCDMVTELDNCGQMRTVSCGVCEAPETCGGAGTPNVCGCTAESDPEFCGRLVKNCDMVTDVDNCGDVRTADCGACTAPATCGGGGTANVCGCSTETDVMFCDTNQAECGSLTAEDTCMQVRTTNCGMCSGLEVCGADAANQCDCPDDAAVCATLGLECGTTNVSNQCDNKTMVDCGGCQANASCGGDNLCACDPGYTPDGLGNCEEIDECAAMPCDTNAMCTDLVNDFDCACNAGYSGDGITCTEDNECDAMPCDANAMCTDLVNDFDCACDAGYVGDGLTCTEIDECAPMPCDPNATCTDLVDDFSCECNAGYTGDGLTCMAVPSIVVSTQTIAHQLPSGMTTSQINLGTSVVQENSVVFVSRRFANPADELRRYAVDAFLADGSTVTLERDQSNGDIDLVVTVVEFDPNEVSVQSGSWSAAGATGIDPVDPAASFVLFTYQISSNRIDKNEEMISVRFTQNDELTFSRSGSHQSPAGHYSVVTALNGGFNVQHVNANIAGGTSSASAGLTAVDPAQSFVLYSWSSNRNAADGDDGHINCALASDGANVSCDRFGTDDGADAWVQVVEVPNAVVERGSVTIASGSTTASATLSGTGTKRTPNLGATGMPGACASPQTADGDIDEAYVTADFSAGGLEFERNEGNDVDVSVTWEVIYWP